MSKFGRRRRQRKIVLGNFYLNPSVQYATTVVSAIALAGFVFSGFLLFRFTDEEDLVARGQQQLAQGKVAWAAKTFQTLVNRHPDSYEGHLLLGRAYLDLNERRKAEREFQIAASLKGGNAKDSAPEIALSKVSMAKGEFLKAEETLMDSFRKNRHNKELKQALFELYEHWGNTLFEAGDKDYAEIVEKYERAFTYVSDYESEQAIKDRLVDSIHMYTDTLIVQHNYEKAIRLLKTSLRFRYTPETLIQIAEAYEKTSNLDEAINWYRKAFDANPKVISLRLTNVLVQKGRTLLDEKKPEEAQKFFDEADRISQKAKIPLDSLYPVELSNVKVDFDIDADTGEFEPKVVMKFSNDAPLPLNFLIAKAEFISGDEELAMATEVVATPDKPMGVKKEKSNSRTVTIQPDTKLNVHALADHKLVVKIYIAYREGEDQVWKQKSLQEIIIKGDETASEPAKQV